jgi:SAM-dependent methyltransferase
MLEEAYRSREAAREYDLRHKRTAARRWVTRREARLVAGLLDGPGENRMILDAACGTGRISALLKARGWEVLSVDASLDMLKRGFQSKSEEGRLVANATLFDLPLEDKGLDGAVSLRFLHHLPERAARTAVLKELARVTRGPIVLSFWGRFNLQSLRRRLKRLSGRRPSARYTLGRKRLEEEAGAAGLRVRKIRCLFPWISETLYALLDHAEQKNENRA